MAQTRIPKEQLDDELASKNVANAFTVGGQTITVADTTNVTGLTINQNDVTNSATAFVINTATDGFTWDMTSTNADTGIVARFYSNSPTPAALDTLLSMQFVGEDSAGNMTTYGLMKAVLLDPTNGSEDGYIEFQSILSGTTAVRFTVGNEINGVSIGASTASGIVSSNGNQDLILQTGNATTGSITIADGASGDITVNPDGNGSLNVLSSEIYLDGTTTNVDIIAGVNYAQIIATDATSGSYIDLYSQDGASYIEIIDTGLGAQGPYLSLRHNSASPAASDIIGSVYFVGEDSASNIQNYATIEAIILDTTSTSEDGLLSFKTVAAGANASRMSLIGTSLYPTTTDGLALGTSSLMWSDLFLASGAVINFNNGTDIITHSTGVLTYSNQAGGATGPILELYQDSASPAGGDDVGTINFYGEDSASNKQLYAQIRGEIGSATSTSEGGVITFQTVSSGTLADRVEIGGTSFRPATNDGFPLGSTAQQWSDLFLAEGGVINWDNGDVTITQTGNEIAVAGGVLKVGGLDVGIRTVGMLISGSASGDSALTTGDDKIAFPIDTTLTGMNLVAVKAYVTTVSSSGAPLFQVRRSRRSTATSRTVVDMLTTGVSIDASEFESADAAAAVSINTSNDDVQTGDILLIDCDTAGTGTKGAQLLLTFQLP